MKYDLRRLKATTIAIIFLSLGTFFGDFFSPNTLRATEFPYTARIIESETYVYSSPTNEGYETSLLKAGDKVELYQINPDGWCAIRPPLGSFSWVSGLYLDVGLDNIGTVLVDQLSSRIGSQLGEHCKTIQVQLQEGEKVILLGRLETPENTASPIWYKIHPPKGEYRWIRITALSPVPQEFQALAKSLHRENALARMEANRTPRKNTVAKSQIAAGSIDAPTPLPRHQLSPVVPVVYEAEEQEVPAPSFDFAFEQETLPDLFAEEEPESVDEGLPELPEEPRRDENVYENTVPDRREVVTENEPSEEYGDEYNESDEAPETEILEQALKNQQKNQPAPVKATQPYANVYIPHVESEVHVSDSQLVNPRLATSESAVSNSPPVPQTPFQRSLSQLRQEVHYVMNRPTDDWVFETLIQKGNTLYRAAPTEADRVRVYQLLMTLDKARQIRKTNTARRHGYVATGPAMTHASLLDNSSSGNGGGIGMRRNNVTRQDPLPNRGAAATYTNPQPRRMEMRGNRVPTPLPSPLTTPPQPESSPGVAQESSQFQAEGRLGWFSHRPEGHPPFAVVNERNEIVAYVTPEPGVNLNPYVNKKVGINGIAGIYIKGDQRAPHIGAKTVTVEPNRY